MDKPFLTIEGQVALLRSRGLIIDGSAADVLMREGYYAVVNGYKEPFIDKEASRRAGEERFKAGTTFGHLHILFKFDRMLRRAAFDALIPAETTFKTACTYAFCSRNEGVQAYLDKSSYCGAKNYKQPNLYEKHLNGLIRTFNHALKNDAGQPSVDHYLRHHDGVPLWVLSNVLTFGNFSYFYALLPRGIQNEVCKIIGKEQGFRFLKTRQLETEASALVSFRNICAHDDRLYCACIGKDHRRYFSDLMLGSQYLVDAETQREFVENTTRAVRLFDSIPWMKAHVMKEMHVQIKDRYVQPIRKKQTKRAPQSTPPT